jgi:hypothetical protein
MKSAAMIHARHKGLPSKDAVGKWAAGLPSKSALHVIQPTP